MPAASLHAVLASPDNFRSHAAAFKFALEMEAFCNGPFEDDTWKMMLEPNQIWKGKVERFADGFPSDDGLLAGYFYCPGAVSLCLNLAQVFGQWTAAV